MDTIPISCTPISSSYHLSLSTPQPYLYHCIPSYFQHLSPYLLTQPDASSLSLYPITHSTNFQLISTLPISVPTTQLISPFLVPISYNLSILVSPPPSNAHPSISPTTRFPKDTHICQTFYARISHHVACMRSLWKFQLLALTRT